MTGVGVTDKERIRSLIAEVCPRLEALGVERLGLFGSFVRGEQRDDSDVDLIVEFRSGAKDFDHFMQLAFLLEELFQRRVELLTPESISPYLRQHILAEVEYASVSS